MRSTNESSETSPLKPSSYQGVIVKNHDPTPSTSTSSSLNVESLVEERKRKCILRIAYATILPLTLLALYSSSKLFLSPSNIDIHKTPSGPYKLLQAHEGSTFFDYYTFYDGPDSLGSAGYNTYVSKAKASVLGIANVTMDPKTGEEFVFMGSSSTPDGPRDSIRLEGNKRFNRGLFILDVRHMPFGAGVWPAFWLTDEDNWPDNGEIDILEGVNYQTFAKTALHTSDRCSMFAHVPDYAKTGVWERTTGMPDTWTGVPNYETNKEADDCWFYAAHQWFNQGCVGVNTDEESLGGPLNDKGGGVFALEWDPYNHYIRSWVFPHDDTMPTNVMESIETANLDDADERIMPDTDTWGLPYAYFAIGDTTGCSADHFKNMRLVFDLAFCGTVAGNRFFNECPMEAQMFNISNDPVSSCNAYIQSEPDALNDAYWKIKGVYVYEREMVSMKHNHIMDTTSVNTTSVNATSVNQTSS